MQTTLTNDGATIRTSLKVRNGFHVFTPDPQAPQFGAEDVRAALEADDLG